MLICFHNSEKIKVDSYEKHLEKTSTFDKGITLASQFLIKIKISISIIYSQKNIHIYNKSINIMHDKML